MKPRRQAPAIILAALALATGYSFWCGSRIHPPELAEDNYTANLLRLEDFQFNDSPGVVLTGSSLTGRLLPSYFAPDHAAPVVNLGLDGSGPLFGLGVIAGHTPPSRLVLIEANLLSKPLNANERVLTAAMDSFEFRLARFCPLFRTSSRPSTHLYAWLKAGHDEALTGVDKAGAKQTAGPATTGPVEAPPSEETTRDAAAVKSLLRARLTALREHGTRFMFFRMPAGRETITGAAPDLAGELAAEFRVPLLDLASALKTRGIELIYTDGRHLAAASARKAAAVLTEMWQKAEK